MPTKIEWTDATWNPVTGCTKIAAGCRNCYAERMAKRLAGRFGYPVDEPFRITFHQDQIDKPHKWVKPRMVFVSSMGDLFHEDVPFEWINSVFITMAYARGHTFQVLTKRPGRILPFLKWAEKDGYARTLPLDLVLPNLWLGTSASTQEDTDRNIPLLLQTPAAVRSVSLEPLLESVVLDADWLYLRCPGCGRHEPYCDCDLHGEWPIPTKLDWVIVGAESGPGARPCKLEWVRSIRDQCQEAGVPLFIKQIENAGKLVKDIGKFPKDLQIREWPRCGGR